MEPTHDAACCCRREFLQAVGAAGAMAVLTSRSSAAAAEEGAAATDRAGRVPTVLTGFAYAAPAGLKEAGYWSWPGSSFDPEKEQQMYRARIAPMAGERGMAVEFASEPLDEQGSVEKFIKRVRETRPGGVVLVLFKKYHWDRIKQVLESVEVPVVIVAPIGVLLADYVKEVRDRAGTYLINAVDVFEPMGDALSALSAIARMRTSVLADIRGDERTESVVKHLGTRVRRVPHAHFYEVYREIGKGDEVRALADAYAKGAMEIVEPTTADITEAARGYFALKRIVEEEKADAVMMDCLPGLRKPHKHVPPCMGFMSLHDEGIVAGCQSDLEATLTMMLVQKLFGRPAFQNNPCLDTESHRYFGAHCTCPSKMQGVDGPAERYILRSHNEAGWGCVPQVLFREGQPVTMVHYFAEAPRMSVYTGEVTRCFPKLAAGCRTNFEMTVNEVDDVRDLVYGGHQVMFYGDGAKRLRVFGQLAGIEVVS